MIGRPSLLMVTAATAMTAAVGNAVGMTVAAPEQAAPSRLGAAINGDAGDRDRATARRARALDLREQTLRAAERRLTTQAAPANDAPTAAGGQAPAPVADQYDDLARIYQAMKPAAAAAVLEQLDVGVQMRVARKMRERSTAMILAAMTPKAAAALTMALARPTPPPPAAPSRQAGR